MTQARTTELEAVNEILSVLGRQPVASLDADDSTSASAFALARLRRASKVAQAEGWHFNREDNVAFTPDGNGEVLLPSNVARIDAAHRYRVHHTDRDLVMRGDGSGNLKVYDKRNNTTVFSEPTIYLDLIRLLDFEDTPQAFRDYVTVIAGRATAQRILGDPAIDTFNREEEAKALSLLKGEEMRTKQPNLLNEWTAYNTTRRRDHGFGHWDSL